MREFEIKNADLAQGGRNRIYCAELEMPFLRQVMTRIAKELPIA